MSKKVTVIISIISIIIVLILFIGLSFAYFSVNLIGEEKETTINVAGGTMIINYSGGAYIDINDIVPSDTPFATKKFNITGKNTTELEMFYQLTLMITENTFTENALKYKLTSVNTSNNGTIIPSISEPKDIKTGLESINLGYANFSPTGEENKVHNYEVQLYFPNSDVNQIEDLGKTFRAYIKVNDYVKPLNSLREAIINQGGGIDQILAKDTPSFKQTNGTGLYSAEDDYGTSYYYRGKKEELNNNLIWAGFQWKIIRINGDGSVRLIYNGTEEQFNNLKTVNNIGLLTQLSAIDSWNKTYINDAKYVGFMYGGANGVASTVRNGITSVAATYNQTSSNIKNQLDNWYKINIVDKGFTNFVTDNLFCNNRKLESEVGGVPGGPGYGNSHLTTYYAPRYNLYEHRNPTLKCDLQNDRFTVNDITIGNGALTYPVGLITGDEASMGGMVYSLENDFNYLYTNNTYWTFSPNRMSSSSGARMFCVEYTGEICSEAVNLSFGIRPVISILSPNVVTGSGSSTNPFVL